MLTLADYAERVLKPWCDAFYDRFEAENPDLMKRLRRNARRRTLYAERKLVTEK